MSKVIRDERDAPFLRLLVRGSALVPLGAAVFLLAGVSSAAQGLAAVAFLGAYLLHVEPFITMYHDVNHRPLFTRRYRWLDLWLFGVFGRLVGAGSGSYRVHHVLMHHAEENGPADVSSTLAYRRDHAFDFIRYYVRFFFSLRPVAGYLAARYPPRYARTLLADELATWGTAAAAACIDPFAALVVLVVPVVVTRSLLIIGNWAEHAFIDRASPSDPLRNSTECVGTRVNGRAFNVGYHAAHHLHPTTHWTTLPERYDPSRWGAADAVVFHDITYPQVWWWLMTHRYDRLAAAFVHLPGAPRRTRDQVVDLLRDRAQALQVSR